MSWINTYQHWLTEREALINAQYVVNFLYAKDKDWSKESISALIGNMRHESSINPNMYEYGYQWGADRGFGLVQWTPRSKYWNWALQNGYSESQLRSGEPQLARIDYEVENNIQYIANGHQLRYGMGTKYNFSFSVFRSNSQNLSINQLTEAFMWNYEGPNYTDGLNSLAERQRFANLAFNSLNWSVKDSEEPNPEPEPDLPPIPDGEGDKPEGIDLNRFIKELNQLIDNMLTKDIYQSGNSEYFQNGYVQLISQMKNSFKIKPNQLFFDEIKKQFKDFNENYIPKPEEPEEPEEPTDPEEPEPSPTTKVFPVRLGNGINFWKRNNWGVGTLQRNMTYGPRSNGTNHYAYDIGGGVGGVKHTIYSVTNGTVLEAFYENFTGYHIVIKNDDDEYFIQYAHLDSFLVKVGDKVTAGQAIARMGNTGWDNMDIHLDIGIAKDKDNFYSFENTIDPEVYLDVDKDNSTKLPLP